jgi:hypothetical protein
METPYLGLALGFVFGILIWQCQLLYDRFHTVEETDQVNPFTSLHDVREDRVQENAVEMQNI